MPINLTNRGLPWAKLNVKTFQLAFKSNGQTGGVALRGLQLAVDPENSVPGWLRIDDNSRHFVAAVHDQPQRQAPSDEHVLTVAMLIQSPQLGDSVYQICDKTFAYLSFVERLYNEAEPNFGDGRIPLIRIIDTPIIEAAKGSTIELVIEIEKWIQRPDAFLEAVRLRDSTAAVVKPDRSAGKGYAEASGRDAAAPNHPRSDLDDESPF